VTSIGNGAFDVCSNLEEISLSGINDQHQLALPTLGYNAFAYTKLNTLYLRDVPEATFNENLLHLGRHQLEGHSVRLQRHR